MSATTLFLRAAGTVAAALLALWSCREPGVISPPQPPQAPPPATSWCEAWDSNEGVLTPAGRIVLLLGERALIDAMGNVTRPAKASPERLSGLVLVPTRTGSTLIGFNGQGIYRFDDPLGEGTLIAGGRRIREVGSAPERIRVSVEHDYQDTWYWLDLQGRPASFSLPAVTWSAFVDMQRGVVSTPYAGLLVTSDGGATWKQVKTDDTPREPDPEQWEERTSRSFQDEHDTGDGVLRVARSSVVDPATGVVSPFKAPKEPPLVRWLRGTRAAPLEAAALGGVPAGNGRALVLGGGMLMTVDLSTGEPTSFVDVRPQDAARFAIRRVWKGTLIGADALFIDEPSPTRHPSSHRPMSLFRASSPLGSGPPTLLTTFEEQARVSVAGSGAVLVQGACPKVQPSPMGDVCSLQPDGSWRNYPLPGRGVAGAASDGGYLFGRVENETIALERVGPSGNATTWATVALPGAKRLESVDEVDADTLHAFASLTSHDGFLASIQTRRGAAPVVTYFDLGWPHWFRGRGALQERYRVHVTLDGGARWHTRPTSYNEHASVSEIGISTRRGFVIGWGIPAPFEPQPRPSAEATLGAPSFWAVNCEWRSGGVARPSMRPRALAGSWASASGTRAKQSAPDPVARVDVVKIGDHKHAWTFQWVDGTVVPAKIVKATGSAPIDPRDAVRTDGDSGPVDPLDAVRTDGGSAPVDPPAALRMEFATATGDRAFFQLRALDRLVNVRVLGSRIEWVLAEEDVKLASIGADGAAAFVTTNGDARSLWVWPKGDAPREVASLFSAPAALSAPARGEIVLLYAVGDDTAMRRVAFDRNTKPALLDASGWSRASVSLRTPTALPRCNAKSAGHRLRAEEADGVVRGLERSEGHWDGTFTLRVTDEQVCLEAMELERYETRIRADFVRNKAEADGGSVVRDLECAHSGSR